MSDIQPVKALLATDGSAHSRAAEDVLAGLRWPAGSAAIVLAAVRQHRAPAGVSTDNPSEVQETLARLQRSARAAAQAIAREAARRLSTAGLATMTVVSEAEPGVAMLGLAAEARADLIAIGAQGFSKFSAPRLGSTAWEVVHTAPTSVLIARPVRRARPLRVVLAADGVMDWLRADDWPLALLPREAEVTVATLAVDDEASAGRDDETAELRAVEFGEALQAQGLTVRNVFPTGEPRAELVRLARAVEADLVIVGGGAAPAPAEAPVLSLAPAVAKFAPCSVLVLRPLPAGLQAAPFASAAERTVDAAPA